MISKAQTQQRAQFSMYETTAEVALLLSGMNIATLSPQDGQTDKIARLHDTARQSLERLLIWNIMSLEVV